MKKKLLIVSHCPSENLLRLEDRFSSAALEEHRISVKAVAALSCDSAEVLTADALILLTPENLGYMSGGMKDFFDRIYYPCLEEKQGTPIAALIRAGSDGTGTVRALETITTGLRWRWVQAPVICRGSWDETFLQQAEELGQAMAYALAEGII